MVQKGDTYDRSHMTYGPEFGVGGNNVSGVFIWYNSNFLLIQKFERSKFSERWAIIHNTEEAARGIRKMYEFYTNLFILYAYISKHGMEKRWPVFYLWHPWLKTLPELNRCRKHLDFGGFLSLENWIWTCLPDMPPSHKLKKQELWFKRPS